MSAGIDALTLAAFVVIAFALASGPQRPSVLRVANVSAAALCLALSVATHVNLPFLAALLLTAAICDFAPQQKLARPFIALAADLGVWMLIYLYRAPQSTRLDYPALSAGWLIAPGFLLFAVSAVGVILKTRVDRRSISIFDTIQVMVAFLLAACGLLYFGPSTKQAIFGLLCLALAAALYAFISTSLRIPQPGNRIVFHAWSAALLLTGIWLCAPSSARPEYLAAAATPRSLRAPGCGALPSAGIARLFCWPRPGPPIFSRTSFRRSLEPRRTPSLSIWLTTICAALCYGLLSARPQTMREGQPFAFLFASIAAMAVAALLAQGSASVAADAFLVGPHHRALIRSLILSWRLWRWRLAARAGGVRTHAHRLRRRGS